MATSASSLPKNSLTLQRLSKKKVVDSTLVTENDDHSLVLQLSQSKKSQKHNECQEQRKFSNNHHLAAANSLTATEVPDKLNQTMV